MNKPIPVHNPDLFSSHFQALVEYISIQVTTKTLFPQLQEITENQWFSFTASTNYLLLLVPVSIHLNAPTIQHARLDKIDLVLSYKLIHKVQSHTEHTGSCCEIEYTF